MFSSTVLNLRKYSYSTLVNRNDYLINKRVLAVMAPKRLVSIILTPSSVLGPDTQAPAKASVARWSADKNTESS